MEVNNRTLFADDTSLLVNNPDHTIFKNDINNIKKKIHKRINPNLLFLNLKKKSTLYNCFLQKQFF